MNGLPSNFKFSYTKTPKERDYSKSSPLVFYERSGKVAIEVDKGTFLCKTQGEIFKILTEYDNLFAYYPPYKNLLLLSLTPDSKLSELNLLGKTFIDGYRVSYMKGKLIIGNTLIVNVAEFYNKVCKSLDEVRLAVKEMFDCRHELGLPPVSLFSPATEARELLLLQDSMFEDIISAKALPRYMLGQANLACKGGRMMSLGIGSGNFIDYDMVMAHNEALQRYPGINNIKPLHIPGYDGSDLDTSIYLINTNISKTWDPSPLRIRTDNSIGLKPAYGNITDWYFKPYLDLLLLLNIEFKVVDAYRWKGEPEYPVRAYMKYLKGAVKLAEARYPNVVVKPLYSTIAGSSKGMWIEVTNDLSEITRSSQTFNPWLYGFALAWVDTTTYLEALKCNAQGLFIDGFITKDRMHKPSGLFKAKSDGVTFLITPYAKVTPNNGREIYHELAEESRNNTKIVAQIPRYTSLEDYFNATPDNPSIRYLGRKYWSPANIIPRYGESRTGKKVKSVGEILDNWLESRPGEGKPDTFKPLEANLPGYLRPFGVDNE